MFCQKPKKPSQFLEGDVTVEAVSKAPYEDEDQDFVPDNDQKLNNNNNQAKPPADEQRLT